jgi:serine/threonine-protein kinase
VAEREKNAPGKKPAPREEQLVGSRIGGVRLEKLLGRGAMGAVFLGLQESLDRRVAVKVLSSAPLNEEASAERFFKEARAAARLNHPNVVQVYDAGIADETPYIIMELVEGEGLGRRIKRQGKLQALEAVDILIGATRGLAAAHERGLIHRDIKPDNILISSDGTPKLADFGLTKDLTAAASDMTLAGHLLGTPNYMSPEACSGSPLDSRSDLYSLGVTLFLAVTGRLPFKATSLHGLLLEHLTKKPPDPCSIEPSIPKSLEALILRLLEKDPESRFPTAQRLVDEFVFIRDDCAADTSAPPLPDLDIGRGLPLAESERLAKEKKEREAREGKGAKEAAAAPREAKVPPPPPPAPPSPAERPAPEPLAAPPSPPPRARGATPARGTESVAASLPQAAVFDDPRMFPSAPTEEAAPAPVPAAAFAPPPASAPPPLPAAGAPPAGPPAASPAPSPPPAPSPAPSARSTAETRRETRERAALETRNEVPVFGFGPGDAIETRKEKRAEPADRSALETRDEIRAYVPSDDLETRRERRTPAPEVHVPGELSATAAALPEPAPGETERRGPSDHVDRSGTAIMPPEMVAEVEAASLAPGGAPARPRPPLGDLSRFQDATGAASAAGLTSSTRAELDRVREMLGDLSLVNPDEVALSTGAVQPAAPARPPEGPEAAGLASVAGGASLAAAPPPAPPKEGARPDQPPAPRTPPAPPAPPARPAAVAPVPAPAPAKEPGKFVSPYARPALMSNYAAVSPPAASSPAPPAPSAAPPRAKSPPPAAAAALAAPSGAAAGPPAAPPRPATHPPAAPQQTTAASVSASPPPPAPPRLFAPPAASAPAPVAPPAAPPRAPSPPPPSGPARGTGAAIRAIDPFGDSVRLASTDLRAAPASPPPPAARAPSREEQVEASLTASIGPAPILDFFDAPPAQAQEPPRPAAPTAPPPPVAPPPAPTPPAAPRAAGAPPRPAPRTAPIASEAPPTARAEPPRAPTRGVWEAKLVESDPMFVAPDAYKPAVPFPETHDRSVATFQPIREEPAPTTGLSLEDLLLRAKFHYSRSKWADAERDYARVIQLDPKHAIAHFALACVLARQDKTAQALDALDRSVVLGFRDREKITSARDLQRLQSHAKFRSVLARLR